jgi:hypothetical protein
MNMISQRAYAIVMVMTAVTTVLPAPLLRILYAQNGAGPGAGEQAEAQTISGQLG